MATADMEMTNETYASVLLVERLKLVLASAACLGIGIDATCNEYGKYSFNCKILKCE